MMLHRWVKMAQMLSWVLDLSDVSEWAVGLCVDSSLFNTETKMSLNFIKNGEEKESIKNGGEKENKKFEKFKDLILELTASLNYLLPVCPVYVDAKLYERFFCFIFFVLFI